MGAKLVALLLILAVSAVAAAVIVPYLREGRVTSQESGAAAALKSGVLPAEVQFQNGGYCDRDHNGIGTYAVVGIRDRAGSPRDPYILLAGGAPIDGVTLDLLAPAYARSSPEINGYVFSPPATTVAPTSTADGEAERLWAAICYPSGPHCRRFFAINQSGNVYSLPEPAEASGARIVRREGESIRELAERTTVRDVFGASFDEIPAGTWDKRPVPRTTLAKPPPVNLPYGR